MPIETYISTIILNVSGLNVPTKRHRLAESIHTQTHTKPIYIPTTKDLLHALNLHWSSILHMVTYVLQCYSLKSSHPHLLPHSSKVCSLYLYCFCCLAYRTIVTIFLNPIYMHQYTISLFPLLPSSLCLITVSLISMCFDEFLIGFILYGTALLGLDWLFPFPCWGSFQL